MDETYVKVRGQWVYLYRAVDKAGKTVDFYLSRNRDVNAAQAFLRKAMKGQRIPAKITLDACAACHRSESPSTDNTKPAQFIRASNLRVICTRANRGAPETGGAFCRQR
jgi:transposase-like protein